MSDVDAGIIPPFDLNVNLRWQHLPPAQRVAVFPRWLEDRDRVIKPWIFDADETKEQAYIEKQRMQVQRTMFDLAMKRCMTPHSKLNISAGTKRKTVTIRTCAMALTAMQRPRLKQLLSALGCGYSGNNNPRKTNNERFSIDETVALPNYKLVQLLREELLPNSINAFEQSILQSRAFVCRTVPSTVLKYPPGSMTVTRNHLISSRDVFSSYAREEGRVYPDAEVAILATARLFDMTEFETENFHQMHRLNLPGVPDYYDRFDHNKSVPLVVHNFPLPLVEQFEDPDGNGQYGLMLFDQGKLHGTSVYCTELGTTPPEQLDTSKRPTLSPEQEQLLFGDWRFCDYDAWTVNLVSPHARFQPPLKTSPPPVDDVEAKDSSLAYRNCTVVLYGVEYRSVKRYIDPDLDKYVDEHDSSINCRRLREQGQRKLGLELALVRYMPTGFPAARAKFAKPLVKQQLDKLEEKRRNMATYGASSSSR